MKKLISIACIILGMMTSVNIYTLSEDNKNFNELFRDIEALAAGEGGTVGQCDTKGWGKCYVIDKPYGMLNWLCEYTGNLSDLCPEPL